MSSAEKLVKGAVTKQEQISLALAHLIALPLVKEALTLLDKALPDNLSYHNKGHTLEVLRESIRFAVTDGLSERELELLAIAAAFHDTGFIKSPVANELIGAEFAREALQRAGGFSTREIQLVEQMILDTKLVELPAGPQLIPSTKLSRYLLDADLSNLGRDDFFDRSELLRQELGVEERSFRSRSLQVITGHRWFTEAAHALGQKKKEENLLLLRSIVASESLDPAG
jgi:uncharacterized protein